MGLSLGLGEREQSGRPQRTKASERERLSPRVVASRELPLGLCRRVRVWRANFAAKFVCSCCNRPGCLWDFSGGGGAFGQRELPRLARVVRILGGGGGDCCRSHLVRSSNNFCNRQRAQQTSRRPASAAVCPTKGGGGPIAASANDGCNFALAHCGARRDRCRPCSLGARPPPARPAAADLPQVCAISAQCSESRRPVSSLRALHDTKKTKRRGPSNTQTPIGETNAHEWNGTERNGCGALNAYHFARKQTRHIPWESTTTTSTTTTTLTDFDTK